MAKVNLAKILSVLGKRAVPNLSAFAFTLQLRKVTETSVKLAEMFDTDSCGDMAALLGAASSVLLCSSHRRFG